MSNVMTRPKSSFGSVKLKIAVFHASENNEIFIYCPSININNVGKYVISS